MSPLVVYAYTNRCEDNTSLARKLAYIVKGPLCIRFFCTDGLSGDATLVIRARVHVDYF